jgi:hypothetical protein
VINSVDDDDDTDFGSRVDRNYSEATDAESDDHDASEDDDHGDERSHRSQHSDDEDDDSHDDDDEKQGSDSGEDYTDDEDEGEDGYKPGGYHRVKVGEVYNQRYVPRRKGKENFAIEVVYYKTDGAILH